MHTPKKSKTTHSEFSRRLAGYSATATAAQPTVSASKRQARLAGIAAAASAALVTVPSVNAGIQDITSSSVTATNINFPLSHASSFAARVTLPFVAGPFHGMLYGLNLSYHGPASTGVGGGALIQGALAHHSGFRASRLNYGAAFAGLNFAGSGLSGKFELAADQQPNGAAGSFVGAHKTGYLAFKTGNYYGWLKAKVGFDTAHGWADQLTLISNGNGVFGAFDQISSTAADGFKVGSLTATPEPSATAIGGLALLALGAAGVREQRRRKQAAAKPTG